jgi:hypothetical protein
VVRKTPNAFVFRAISRDVVEQLAALVTNAFAGYR